MLIFDIPSGCEPDGLVATLVGSCVQRDRRSDGERQRTVVRTSVRQ